MLWKFSRAWCWCCFLVGRCSAIVKDTKERSKWKYQQAYACKKLGAKIRPYRIELITCSVYSTVSLVKCSGCGGVGFAVWCCNAKVLKCRLFGGKGSFANWCVALCVDVRRLVGSLLMGQVFAAWCLLEYCLTTNVYDVLPACMLYCVVIVPDWHVVRGW